ncbi:MAG: hypothetical protein CM15mP77_0490 [Synechococcus sp.]|nr:MAG: hypothetical protein CM15mP77_0490 [Synechococcus sp.]
MFSLKGGYDDAVRFINSLQLASHSPTWGCQNPGDPPGFDNPPAAQ